jgi:hypothetical protein
MFAQNPCMKFFRLYALTLLSYWFLPVSATAGASKKFPPGGRTYAAHSVLASGNWYKLAITRQGIYRIDVPLLNSMGINASSLKDVRLFGSGGQMLPEDNSSARPDDLPEVALLRTDDYLLFYATGPNSWAYQGSTYNHTLNLYSDTSYYFLTLNPGGKTIATDNSEPAATVNSNAFDYHDFYESDSLNFLASGKEWWGTLFTNLQTTRTVNFTLPSTPTSLKIATRVAARSLSSSRFSVLVNNFNIGNLDLQPVTGDIFEAFATTANGSFASPQVSSTTIPVSLNFTPGGSDGQGWMGWLELTARCPLQLPAQEPLFFRDMNTVGAGQTALYQISGTDNMMVWDITDALNPVQLKIHAVAGGQAFSRDCSTLHEYMATNSKGWLTPRYIGTVANQDLHALSGAGLLIITIPALVGQATQLAAYHNAHDGLTTQVVTVNDIYNEFGSGSPDPTAIRDFIKMCYDRGNLQNVLLFGDASYDYKQRVSGNTNLVPTWESGISTDPLNAFPSDDFYGFLGDGDDINNGGLQNLLKVPVGRLPVQNTSQANVVVNKIIQYTQPANFGGWQQHITFVADDGDDNLHLQDAESMSTISAQQWPAGVINKIYLDAYPKVSDASGSRYPAVNNAIAEDIFNGTLIWNYTGHGSYSRLAEEVIMEQSTVAAWNNGNRLPLFITATCDFAAFDNPSYTSLGEQVLLQENGGGIALMTTTRDVFAASNKVLNANFLDAQLTPGPDGRMPTLGQAAMTGKNMTYISSPDIANNRKFQLLGDPALTLAFPSYKVLTDSLQSDTLSAYGMYTLKGHIADASGQPQNDYTGTVLTTVYDKPALQYTRGNDGGSTPAPFYLQQNVLYKGQQSIQNGKFTCTFVVPADISYQLGAGMISYYASNGVTAAGGADQAVQVGGTSPDAGTDSEGPQIKAYLDNTSFRDGDLTGQNPVLLLHLYDEHGINTTGYGIGHDLVATLDHNADQYYILNNFFVADLDSYEQGTVTFPFYGLAEGKHTLSIRAWDTYNNSDTALLLFRVVNTSKPTIQDAACFPNPFRDQTSFTFLHNQEGQQLDVTVRIFTTDGKQIKIIQHTINASGSRYVGANWNGNNDAGSRMPPGIYIYSLMVKVNGKTTILGGKVVLL